MRARLTLLVLLAVAGCDATETRPGTPASGWCQDYPSWETSDYVLPYPAGASYYVIQGNCGSFSHHPGTRQEYAYDFVMPIGTPIVAARAGRVYDTEESYSDNDHTLGHQNSVIVEHTDGSFGRYFHLTTGGVDVDVGDFVQAGDSLGRSGNSGFSTTPHLHFDVVTDCTDTACRAVPVTFRNTTPNPRGLLAGRTYTAE